MQARTGFVVGLCAVVLGIFVAVMAASLSHHPDDASLIGNFRSHQSEFQNLPAMASQDPTVVMVRDSFVYLVQPGANTSHIYLYRDKPWPASEAVLNFSKLRWDQYLSAFKNLGLKGGMDRKSTLPDAVFFAASVRISELDNDETAVIEKGYVYVPGNLQDNLKDTLDNIKISRPAIFYRRIQDHWYLYYEWSVSKPE